MLQNLGRFGIDLTCQNGGFYLCKKFSFFDHFPILALLLRCNHLKLQGFWLKGLVTILQLYLTILYFLVSVIRQND